MPEYDITPTPEEMATLNGVTISPELMHTILASFMTLPDEKRVGSDCQHAGLLTVCNALDVPGDKELLALVVHLRISALNILVEQGALRDWVLVKDGTSMDLTSPIIDALATETLILDGGRNFAFDADGFRQCVSANGALQTRGGLPRRTTRGRHPHHTGTGHPGRHAGRSH